MAEASRNAIVVMSSHWSHDGRPWMALPMASTWTGRLRSAAASARERPRHEAPGAEVTAAAAAHRDAGPALLALGRALPHRAEAEDVVGVAGADRRARGDHRTQLARILDAAVVPVEVEAQGILDLDDARSREPRGKVHVSGVGGDAVDVVARQTGVLDGGQRRVESELEGVSIEAPSDV